MLTSECEWNVFLEQFMMGQEYIYYVPPATMKSYSSLKMGS
jgi:hypothetical protein